MSAFFVLSLFQCGIFENCIVDPDLVSDLLAPSADIIQGEPVDWDYTIESVENRSDDCQIVEALASIAAIVIDLFEKPSDTSSDEVFNEISNINGLSGGQSQIVSNRINVFNQEGVYMVMTEADITNTVDERNETNNTDSGEAELRGKISSDYFGKTSLAFQKKLSTTSAIVIVSENANTRKIKTYKGIPVYYSRASENILNSEMYKKVSHKNISKTK